MILRHHTTALTASIACLGALLSGCSGGGDPYTVTPETLSVTEFESNDTVGTAQGIGLLPAGTTIEVSGDVSALGADQFDTFAFTSDGATSVDFRLAGDNPAVDLDLWLLDDSGGVTEFFQVTGTGAPEIGSFEVASGSEVQVVVYAFGADSNYVLELTGQS